MRKPFSLTDQDALVLTKLPRYHWLSSQNVVFFGLRSVDWLVPAGFITDFASIPVAVWGLYQPDEIEVAPAFLLHDFLYRTQNGITRRYADWCLHEILRRRGLGRWPRLAIYWAVRLNSKKVWLSYSRQNVDIPAHRIDDEDILRINALKAIED